MPFFKRLWKERAQFGEARPDDGYAGAGMVSLEHESAVQGDLPPLRKEGLNWLTLMASGKATTADLDAMERWRRQSLAHGEALAWALRLRRLVAIQDFPRSAAPVPLYQRPVTRRLALGGATAAAAGYALASPPMGLWPSWAELTSDFRTATGENKTLALADGISLHLNTGTAVSRNSDRGAPSVQLVQGEVLVTIDKRVPAKFSVYADAVRIGAVAGSFDIRRSSESTCVTCIEGSVEVAHPSAIAQLAAGQQLTFTPAALGKPVKVDIAMVTAWQRGQLIFRDARFSEIVSEVNRYRQGRIVVLNSGLAERRFNCVFQIAALDEIATNLRQLSNASVTNLPGNVILLS